MRSLSAASTFEAVDDVLRAALGRRFTAAVARIERGGELVYERAFGTTRLDACGRPVYVDTRFDLASITKLYVATLALGLVASGSLTLDAPLSGHITQWKGTPHEAITLRMLLAHTSGMNSGADYRAILNDDVRSFALSRPLVAQPEARVIYSDLGFIALGVVLERTRSRSLAAQIGRIWGGGVGFNPHERERLAIPATEDDGWRGRVQGRVHDEKAYLMNGAAGHAGLFAGARDVAALVEPYLASACGRAQSALPSSLAREAIACAADDPVLRRGLGWALKTTDENSCGARFGPRSFGHTGFTGTCVWADPDRDLQAVLLTNAVYFGREDSRPLRAAFYDAVIETFG
ncbi:MAG TPA: serine hydrolase domain-containing protein [Candidatus Baltobacteraceae bacterium]|nr:serine hydrolase domain-containing protein [Candidatus Baltobacteraceae bacterium]